MSNDNVLEATYPYTLGRGKVLIQSDTDTQWLDLGNVKEFNVTVNTEILDHFGSRSGIRRIDRSSVTQQTGEGNFIIDVPVIENVKLFYMGATPVSTDQTSGSLAAVVYELDDNRWTDIGFEDLTITLVTGPSATPTYDLNDDFVLDLKAGLIAPVDGGAITPLPADVEITGTYTDITRTRVDGGAANNQKRHLWYIGDPAEGVIQSVKGFANITPNGDMALIGDEWQELPFSMKFEASTRYLNLMEYHQRGIQVAG